MTDGLFGHIFSISEKKNFKIFFILLYEDDYKIAAYTNVTNHGMTPKLPAVLAALS